MVGFIYKKKSRGHAYYYAAENERVDGKMQRKVGAIFNENKENPPDILWAHSIEELNQ